MFKAVCGPTILSNHFSLPACTEEKKNYTYAKELYLRRDTDEGKKTLSSLTGFFVLFGGGGGLNPPR